MSVIHSEATTRIAEPIANLARCRVSPKDVAGSVTVEIANSSNLPRSGYVGRRVIVIDGKPAARGSEPITQRAIIVEPEDVAATVAIEVVGNGMFRRFRQLNTARRNRGFPEGAMDGPVQRH